MKHKVENIDRLIIDAQSSLLEAMKQMDANDCKSLIVFQEGRFQGLLSIGDIQRRILAKGSIDYQVKDVLRKNIVVARVGDSSESIGLLMEEKRIEIMPVLDDEGELVDVIFWKDRFGYKQRRKSKLKGVPLVIMAGGRGLRLKPITDVIPKPLIPLGGKPIIETIINSFVEEGCSNILLSVNYKSEIIKFHFESIQKKGYSITFFEEKSPLGTAGSLRLIRNKINSTFFVSNCDIFIDQDYHEILSYHKKSRNELTAVAAIKEFSIPYGTFELSSNGSLKDIKEKPKSAYYVNAGMYILEPELLDEIPNSNDFFHITDLIKNILARNGRIGVFPVSEGSWFDIGNWNVYDKSLKGYQNRFG